ncbi:MAG: flagellar hook-length control protein FliK [Candidatus Thiodiazotropha sp. (ex Dulcina madagascariensis)]|nr:flagellar hook-length control protein FliK [Candidatus Thiodiazotropha sp. (ex Dulcina madagascariensis)]MCU7926407.1 flagellar hook-length control protein FliK [Candidatus Thiodiazotropha sp. (ex Dulcina madagascariensis)]
MQIPDTKIVLPLPTLPSAKPLLQNLQPGQILQGTVLSENLNGSIQLKIGVTRLLAQTALSVRVGQPLTLQVEKAGDLPELRVLTLPSLAELKTAALKSVLPRQQPLPELFKALTQIVADSGGKSLPPPVREAVEHLLTRVVSLNDPSFKAQLTKALQISGTQTEARLIEQNLVGNDFKLNLLRLIGIIKPLINPQAKPADLTLPLPQQPPVPIPTPAPSPEMSSTTRLLLDLFKHLDGAIARIQTNQLSSLPTEDPTRQVWQFELPIRQDKGFETFHIRIDCDGPRKEGDSAVGWSLTLHMNLRPLGPMRVRLYLLGDAISTVIWCERKKTSGLVRQHLDKLRTGLESAGLEVKKLESFQGDANNEYELPNEHSLLNVKA